MHEVVDVLSAWNSFYVMIGSSAAALTGLMFVVITLVTGTKRGTSKDGVSAFSTPTVVHFSCALFTAALMSAPFRSLVPIAIILGISGAAGLFHVVRVARRTARLETYTPDVEDWTWHVALPFVAYATILIGALALHADAALALYAPAAAVTLLIFVGIHNAWDVVTFIATASPGGSTDRPSTTQATPDPRGFSDGPATIDATREPAQSPERRNEVDATR
jgi:hypothetical protein